MKMAHHMLENARQKRSAMDFGPQELSEIFYATKFMIICSNSNRNSIV